MKIRQLVTLVSKGDVAALDGAEMVVRANQFELLDDQGRVRAQLFITQPTTMPDGE